jgi:4,5-DOPA dioxygenase extradiol
MSRIPVLFVSHGAPISLEDPEWMKDLEEWSLCLPPVREILVISAHWVTAPLTIGPAEPVPLLYDFYGFPDRLYREQYSTPVSTCLMERLEGIFGKGRTRVERNRGLDHGMWVPLKGLFPRADIPVLGLSLPGLDPDDLHEMGRRLSPLREEGVLILCSGGMTHNLGELSYSPSTVPASWAMEFDQWVTDKLLSGKRSSILSFDTLAPHGRRAHPSTEHFAPLFVALGASGDSPENVSFPVSGFRWGTLSMKSVQFGGA